MRTRSRPAACPSIRRIKQLYEDPILWPPACANCSLPFHEHIFSSFMQLIWELASSEISWNRWMGLSKVKTKDDNATCVRTPHAQQMDLLHESNTICKCSVNEHKFYGKNVASQIRSDFSKNVS